jgi:heptosyltransferase-2
MARLLEQDALLLRLPNWLGDFVMAEPAIDALARAQSRGQFRRLALVAPERFYDLIEGRFEGVARLAPGADWRGFDASLFLNGSMGCVMKAWRAGIYERWGWNSGLRQLALSEGFMPALERGGLPVGLGQKGRGERRLPRDFGACVNELVGTCGVSVVDRAPRLSAGAGARRSVLARLEDFGLQPQAPYWVLDASARKDSAKAPQAELWHAALERTDLNELPPLILLSAPGESSIARALAQQLSHPRVHLFDDLPPTLGELLAVIESAQLFVGPDSGPRHLASACGVPQVVLYGPTDPRHTAGHNRRTLGLRVEVDCGPCHQEQCPLPGDDRGHCMSGISAEELAGALQAALS